MEVPLAAPVLVAGVRTAAVEVFASATLAAYAYAAQLAIALLSGAPK